MGGGSFNMRSYTSYAAAQTLDASTGARKSTQEVFTTRHIHETLNPTKVAFRESCDSADNPESTPIIIALDVTGSMGYLATEMLNNQLGKLMEGIHNCPFITNPHIMFMAVGDYSCDESPLQVSQFEADLRIAEQLRLVFNEQGGGGNNHESYHLPWYFASHHCRCDSITKRGKKGYLFTIGDEEMPQILHHEKVNKLLEHAHLQQDVTIQELYDDVSKSWEVFHMVIEQGSHYRYHGNAVDKSWRKVLGPRALNITDFNYVADVAVAAFDIVNGTDPDTLIRNTEDKQKREVFKKAFREKVVKTAQTA